MGSRRLQYGQRASKNSTMVTSPAGLPATGSAGSIRAFPDAAMAARDAASRSRPSSAWRVLDRLAEDAGIAFQRVADDLDDLVALCRRELLGERRPSRA